MYESERLPSGVDPHDLRGAYLRQALLTLLSQSGRLTTTQLIAELEQRGLTVHGSAPKTVGDALRLEVKYGRARRVGRATYVALPRPASTERRHRAHFRGLVAAARPARPNGW